MSHVSSGPGNVGQTCRHPLRSTSASRIIDATKPIHTEGSCSNPNQLPILSLIATNPRDVKLHVGY